jgi:hypothetical protein
MSCIGGNLGFLIVIKKYNFVEDRPMIILGQFCFICPSGIREEAFWDTFPRGSNVKLSPTVAAIFHFILTLWGKCFKTLLLWNHLDNWKQTAQEWSLEGPVQSFCLLFDRKSKMATTAEHRLTLDPMVKYSNAFFSETTNMIKAKLYMNVHWMVLYKLYFFCSDMKFKMAATAGLSLTAVWFQLSKWFQRRNVLKHFSHRLQC